MFEMDVTTYVWDRQPSVETMFIQTQTFLSLWSSATSYFQINEFLTVVQIETHSRPNLTLPCNRSMSSQGNHLYIWTSGYEEDEFQVFYHI